MSKSRRTKATTFNKATINEIMERDKGCIFCRSQRFSCKENYGTHIFDIAHIVNRSQGGLGIGRNGVLVCRYHHNLLDNGNKGMRGEMLEFAEEYLKVVYPGWKREELIYKKC